MYIKDYKGHVSELYKVISAWNNEYKGNDFNIIVDIPIFASSLNDIIVDDDSSLLSLINNEDEIVGIIGMTVFDNPLNGDKVANEHFWYVLEEYRGRGSIMLLRASQKWAKENNCKHIMLNASNLASSLHDKICNIYEKIGMKKIETSYIMEV